MSGDWVINLAKWADEYLIGEDRIPRDRAKIINLDRLDLSGLQLSSIPEEIANLNIRELRLHDNNFSLQENEFKGIPDMHNLKNLKNIYFDGDMMLFYYEDDDGRLTGGYDYDVRPIQEKLPCNYDLRLYVYNKQKRKMKESYYIYKKEWIASYDLEDYYDYDY